MVIFIVPAYNEEANIGRLLTGMQAKLEAIRCPARVIIVDDASQDRTGEIAQSFAPRLSVEVVRNPVNRGVAEAFRAGFRRALEIAGPEDVIVTKEADNTSDLSVLEAMLARTAEGYDFVLASCFAPQGKVVNSTMDRHVLSWAANWLLRTFFPIPGIHTYSSFYRAYRAETLRRAFEVYEGKLLECQGFGCMVEMLVKMRRLPVRMVEVPMVLQCDLRRGPSKMRRLRTIQEYLHLIRREAFRSRLDPERVRRVFERPPEAPVVSLSEAR